jgi:serine phosphatase RsbU (regulator of sigma subunit)
VADPGAGTIAVCNAGHPPPSVLRADGKVDRLPVADGPPLGVEATGRVTGTEPFLGGDTVLAFTDGLVERRDEDIDTGLDRLGQAVPLLAGAALEGGVARLVEAVRDDTYDDDMAAIALRRVR